MRKRNIVVIVALAFLSIINPANAATVLLQTNDFVGITFWIVSMGMLAGAVFFFLERNTVAVAWKASVTVAGLVCLIAFVHYIYIRNIWVTTGDVPTAYRYVDWLITIPMQTIEFYLILAAVRKVSDSIFWRLLIASSIMLKHCKFYEPRKFFPSKKPKQMSAQRLQKIISMSGRCSRRKAEELLSQNRVTVNGISAKIGDQADPNTDNISIDGSPLSKNVANEFESVVQTAPPEFQRTGVWEPAWVGSARTDSEAPATKLAARRVNMDEQELSDN